MVISFCFVNETADDIHTAIQEKQLIPVKVEDIRDLLYNSMIELIG